MAKVQQKSEKITAFGGIFFVLDRFDRILSSVIDFRMIIGEGQMESELCQILRPTLLKNHLTYCLVDQSCFYRILMDIAE